MLSIQDRTEIYRWRLWTITWLGTVHPLGEVVTTYEAANEIAWHRYKMVRLRNQKFSGYFLERVFP